MAAAAPTAPREVVAEVPTPRELRQRRREMRRGSHGPLIESLLIVVVLTMLYTAVGKVVVVDRHALVGDSISRLAHAYFAWYNEPPKLAGIGFAWPPVQTLYFLPFGLIKPLSMSLLALPIASGLAAAAMVATINRALAWLEVSRSMRAGLLIPFALNPLFVFYATNGMSETLYLLWLALAGFALTRWWVTDQHHILMLAGLALALGFLTRYELLGYAGIFTVIIALKMRHDERRGEEIEGTMLAFLSPVFYAVLIWCFLSWLIVDDPLFWFKDNFGANLASDATGTARIVNAEDVQGVTVTGLVNDLISLNLQLFLPTLVVAVILVNVAAYKRDGLSFAFAVLCLFNAIMTAALVLKAQDEFLLQLRYNLRSWPFVLIGAGIVLWHVRARRPRWIVWGLMVGAMVAAAPLSWHAMVSWPHRYYEGQWAEAARYGIDQEGLSSRGGYFQAYGIGFKPERDMAAIINARVKRKFRVLTDDRFTFGVLLASGKPELFYDRIDFGDARWDARAKLPYGRVDYVLVSKAAIDKTVIAFPGLVNIEKPREPGEGYPGFVKVADTGPFALFRVPRRPPPMAYDKPRG